MEKYTPFGHSDYQTIVADVKKFATGKRTAVVSTINGDSNVPFYKELGNQGLKATDIPVVAFSVGEEELRGIDTKPLVGHLAAWNYFMSMDTPENKAFIDKWKAYVKKNNLPGGDKRVTNDPMEATYIGIHMWAQAVEQAKTTNVDAVRQAVGYQHFKAPSGFDIQLDAKNHHLWKPVVIGEVKADGQFRVVWKTEGPIRAQAWSPFIPDSAKKVADWTYPWAVRQLHGAEVRRGRRGGGQVDEATSGRRGPRAEERRFWRRSSVSPPSPVRGPTPARSKMRARGSSRLASPSSDTIEASIRKLAALDDPRGAAGAGRALRRSPARRRRRSSVHLGFEDPRRPPPADRRGGVAGAAAAEGGRGRQRDSPRGAAGAGAAPARHRRRRRCGWRPPRSCRRAARPRRRRCCTARWTREKDAGVREALALAVARADLAGTEPAARIAALDVIGKSGNDGFLSELQRLTAKGADGERRRDRPAACWRRRSARVDAVKSHQRVVAIGGSLLHGLSLASVLLFAALGLAITFGLLGVINMAHGEMLMLGAYATYTVQTLMHGHRFYLLAAIPVAFLATGVIGVALERGVIRHLYGRPLETLLATWGISLGLIQTVRLIFGAQNVAVANPDWLAGGVRDRAAAWCCPGAASPWSGSWCWSRRPSGSSCRRRASACRSAPSRRTAAWRRAWASAPSASTRWCSGSARGSPGWAASRCRSSATSARSWGRATSSTRSWSSCWAAWGGWRAPSRRRWASGIINKLIEPAAGAVLGKIIVLVFIILFIQRRPQGLFALKGRVEAD